MKPKIHECVLFNGQEWEITEVTETDCRLRSRGHKSDAPRDANLGQLIRGWIRHRPERLSCDLVDLDWWCETPYGHGWVL